MTRGLASMGEFAGALSYPVLLLCVVGLIKTATRISIPLYLASISGAAVVYNVFAGGDAWEWGSHANRFQLPIVPIVSQRPASAS